MSSPASSENPSTAVVDASAESVDLPLTQKAGDAANRWLARNRSLVLRQTPVWAQSLAALMIGLGGIAVVGGIFFRIDEVVTVQGQLKSIGGTIEVKTPAGGRVAEVLFQDGDNVVKGQKLLQFDTRQAASEKASLTRQIALEEKQLLSQLKTLKSQSNTLSSREDVLRQRLNTKSIILDEMRVLVDQGGFQRLQYLEQKDQLFELQKQVSDIAEQRSQVELQAVQIKLQSEKSINQMRKELQSAELQLQYRNVLAPVSGMSTSSQ